MTTQIGLDDTFNDWVDLYNALDTFIGDRSLTTSAGNVTDAINELVVNSTIDSMADISSADTSLRFLFVKSYHEDFIGGGGFFKWSATEPRANHNGGTIICPNTTYPTDWNNTTQLNTWFSPTLTNYGCWLRLYQGEINVQMFGVVPNGSSGYENTIATQKAVDVATALYVDGTYF